MTNQTLTRSSLPKHETSIHSSTQQRSRTKIEPNHVRQVRTSYQAIQQLKYLHLQAEIDVLLQELQTMKQRNYTDN